LLCNLSFSCNNFKQSAAVSLAGSNLAISLKEHDDDDDNEDDDQHRGNDYNNDEYMMMMMINI
jgi:hypothetical protein